MVGGNSIMSLNYDGTIDAAKVYTEKQLALILGISEKKLVDYYKQGLNFYQRTRQQSRQISGAEYHRFIERNLQGWADDEEEDEAAVGTQE
jgi:hypothetical protein